MQWLPLLYFSTVHKSGSLTRPHFSQNSSPFFFHLHELPDIWSRSLLQIHGVSREGLRTTQDTYFSQIRTVQGLDLLLSGRVTVDMVLFTLSRVPTHGLSHVSSTLKSLPWQPFIMPISANHLYAETPCELLVIGRIVSPKGDYLLIPETCEYVTLTWQKGLYRYDYIKYQVLPRESHWCMNSVSLEIEIILDYPGGPSVITRVLTGGRQESYRQSHDYGSRVMWSHEPRIVVVSMV